MVTKRLNQGEWKLYLAAMSPPLIPVNRGNSYDGVITTTRMLNPPTVPQYSPVNPVESARQFRECTRTVQQAKDTISTTFEDGLITPALFKSMNYLLDDLLLRFQPTANYPIGLPTVPLSTGGRVRGRT